MQRGIYTDSDNNIVYFGNRKPSDPVGLIWVELDQNPGKLREFGVYAWKWDGSNIIVNPELVEAEQNRQNEQLRKQEIETEQTSGGLKGITVQQAKDIIKGRFDDVRALPIAGANNAETIANIEAKIDALIDACEWVDKKEAVYLLR
jgi:hypothetical protein